METHSHGDEESEVPPRDEIDPPAQSANGEPSDDSGDVPPTALTTAVDDELASLAVRARAARLTATEEERAIALLKESMLDGKNGIARVTDSLPSFPWIVAVRGIESVWPELKTTGRAQFVKGLAEQESEAARRIRLSLARALFKQDVPIALKIASAVARQMVKSSEGETLSPTDIQIFSNVFIGKAKPWVAQLPLDDLKAADADAIVQCAVTAAFAVPHPPPTQLGVLKWAAASGRLAKMNEATLQTVMRGISRWSGKWRAALRSEVDQLPESIAASLQRESDVPRARAQERTDEAGDAPTPGDSSASDEVLPEKSDGQSQERKERPVYQPRPQKSGGPSPAPSRPSETQRERPVYQPRGAAASARDVNIGDVLRQVEAHVAWLRSELQTAHAKLRDESKQGRRPKSAERAADRAAGELRKSGEQTAETLEQKAKETREAK